MRKGKIQDQRKRYKKMKKEVARAPDEYLLIDGNWSHYPYAYCSRKHAYLTKGLCSTHHCEERNCNRYERVVIM